MLASRQIIAGRRSRLTPAQERAVVAKFKAWAKKLRRKPTMAEALDYFLTLPPSNCLWTEFCTILQGRGLIAI